MVKSEKRGVRGRSKHNKAKSRKCGESRKSGWTIIFFARVAFVRNGGCKQFTAPLTYDTRAHVSRAAHGDSPHRVHSLSCVVLQQSSHERASCRTLGLITHPQSTSVRPSRQGQSLCAATRTCLVPQQGLMSGRSFKQSPSTSYEPNSPVEDSSAEVTTMLSASTEASIGSTFNSGEDLGTIHAVSMVAERSNWATLVSCDTGLPSLSLVRLR